MALILMQPPRNQVPEWAAFYINYKGLKKLVKAAATAAGEGEQVDLAGGNSPSDFVSPGAEPILLTSGTEFFFVLDRNLEDVDSFYNKKYAEACRRLKLLQDRYGGPPDLVAHLDQDEVEELMGALLSLGAS